MKQTILLVVMIALGTAGSFYNTFWGLLLYYTLAVLRPQYLWDWALPAGWRWSLMAAGAVFIGVVSNLPRLTMKSRLNRIAVLLIIYALLILLSMLNAIDVAVAQEWALEFGKIVLIAVIATLTIDSVWQINLLAVMVVVTIGYAAWDINAKYFLDGRLDIYNYGYGGLDNNGAGLVLAMGIPFAYSFAVSAKRLWVRLSCWGASLLMIHAMLMSYSRGAMVSTIVGVVWLLIHHRPRRNALAIVLAICLVLPVMAGKEIQARFFSTSNVETDPSINSRLESWAAAWAMAWDHPMLGEGVRNSNRYAFNYGADVHGRTIHSQYLQIAADSGIPAMTLYITILVVSFWTLGSAGRACAKVREECRHGPDPDNVADRAERLRYLMLSCQGSLLIFMTGSGFLSLEVFELPWLLIVIAGVVPGAVARELERHQSPRTPVPLVGTSHHQRPRPVAAGLLRDSELPPDSALVD